MKDTATYRALLNDEKVRLEEALQSVGRKNPSNPADWEAVPEETGQEPDVLDAGAQIEGFEGNTGILKELEARYNQVLAALARIEAGTYGICSVSGEEIEEDRLGADPAAETCKAHLNG